MASSLPSRIKGRMSSDRLICIIMRDKMISGNKRALLKKHQDKFNSQRQCGEEKLDKDLQTLQYEHN